MAVRNISFDEATPDQKRAYARDFLNLELQPNATDDQVDSLLRSAQPGIAMIFYLEEEEVAPAPAPNKPLAPGALKFEDGAVEAELRPEEGPGRQVGSLGKEDPRWLIEIPVVETEDGSGGKDVIVGVNGRAWQIKRGVEVSLPHRVIVALDHAVTSVLRHNPDNGDDIRRESKRFPYQIIERPSKDAIAAWDKAMASQFCA